MTMTKCYCGSQKLFLECCEPHIKGSQKAPTAEALMRSRYAAYATCQVDYLIDTTHPSKRKFHAKEEILSWAMENNWDRLEIIALADNVVEFKAYFRDKYLRKQIHHERSTFKFENGSWYYLDGTFYK